MEINWYGVASIIVFYVIIFIVGVVAARNQKSTESDPDVEDVMVAGRDIGLFVGVFTMTATWVGGGYINGTAEVVYTKGSGLLWAQAPIGYALSLVIGGLFFAKKMRDAKYVTMLDPFQQQFGRRVGSLLFLPALSGELFWSAAILSALGNTIAVIIDLDTTISIIISAVIAVAYTVIGGLYSVAYTDVVQLLCIVIGLVLSIPFAYTSEFVTPITTNATEWMGEIEPSAGWLYADGFLLLMFGGIPWQVYFQRVLSAKSAKSAQILSFAAAIGCILLAIPPVLIGAIGASADWEAAGYSGAVNNTVDASKILPLVLQYLTPTAVSFFGLGAVSAAVMSSADSSLLSASSMFSRNIYKNVFRQAASERELLWVMRVSVLIFATISIVMAIFIPSIYGLWYLCSDFVYVILFPHLVAVVYISWVNAYGAISAFTFGLIIRLLGGEPLLGLKPVIEYPLFDGETQYFPFKTLSMIITLTILLVVSAITRAIFLTSETRRRFDFLGVYRDGRHSLKKQEVTGKQNESFEMKM